MVNISLPEKVESSKINDESLDKFKSIIYDKGNHKDWTQREIALQNIQECFQLVAKNTLNADESFLSHCCLLLKQALEDNNI